MAKDKQLPLSADMNDIDMNNESGLTDQERLKRGIGIAGSNKKQQKPKKAM